MKIILKDVIEKLPPESKKLVKMYYYEDMSQKEIAQKLNYTQMQISRRMKKAFSLLYHMIADKTDVIPAGRENKDMDSND